MNIQIFKRLPVTLVAKLNQKLRFVLVEKRQNDALVAQKASRVPSTGHVSFVLVINSELVMQVRR